MKSEKYYLVFCDAYPSGKVLTSDEIKKINGYKYTAEVDETMINVINEALEDHDLAPERILSRGRAVN